jgi:hypothetical protein
MLLRGIKNYEQILPYSGSVVKGAPATSQENFKLDKAYPCDKMSLGHHLFYLHQHIPTRPTF